MLMAMITRFAAKVEIKRRRLVATAVAGVFLLAALVFAVSAVWLALAAELGAIFANMICAAVLALVGIIILLVGRPRRLKAVPPVATTAAVPPAAPGAPVAPVASSTLFGEIMGAFAAGSELGRSMRR
jgi:hypothetical protein